MSKVDFLKNTIKVGDYFVVANISGRSSATLLIGRVTGWKKDRMFYVRGYLNYNCNVSYTTRYDDLLVIPEDVIPYDLKLKMEPLWMDHSKLIEAENARP